jgi:hypothetical protein
MEIDPPTAGAVPLGSAIGFFYQRPMVVASSPLMVAASSAAPSLCNSSESPIGNKGMPRQTVLGQRPKMGTTLP